MCNYCGNVYKYLQSGGYGSFRTHINKFHPEMKDPQESGSSSNPSQLIDFNDELHINSLSKFCVYEDLSARVGESLGFLDYAHETYNHDVNPVILSSNIKSRRRQYKEGKEKLISLFAKMNNNISISTDIWADCWDVHSYMGVTCHWIDDEFKIQKRLLSFRMLRSREGKKKCFYIVGAYFT
jgi:hypothetical protein